MVGITVTSVTSNILLLFLILTNIIIIIIIITNIASNPFFNFDSIYEPGDNYLICQKLGYIVQFQPSKLNSQITYDNTLLTSFQIFKCNDCLFFMVYILYLH